MFRYSLSEIRVLEWYVDELFEKESLAYACGDDRPSAQTWEGNTEMWERADLDAEQVKRDDEVPAVLARLKLGTSELRALRHQGFVSRERRGGCWIYRLRFRVEGRQVTRYVGTDTENAAEVQQSLAEWQAERSLDLELGRLARQAGRELKRAKNQLIEQLASRGFGFHGLGVRRAQSRQK